MKPRTRTWFTIGSGGLLYLIVAALILTVATYTQTNLLFWGFGLMVGGLSVSVLLSFLMLHGLGVERVLPGHGVAFESMTLRYQITNHKRWLPVFGLVICESWGRPPDDATRAATSPPPWKAV